jgi:Protein of unknown function (DUF1800)
MNLRFPVLLRNALLLAWFSGQVYAQTIVVYNNASLAIGDSRAMSAYVPLPINTITWSVNGILGGNQIYGTVVSTGVGTAIYQTPSSGPAKNVVTIRATSTAQPTKFGEAQITITQPVPWDWGISPSSVPAGPFTILVDGGNYGANSVVSMGGVPLVTTQVSSTKLRAVGTTTPAHVGHNLPVTVTNVGFGAVTSPSANLTVTAPAPAVKVTVSPSAASVPRATAFQFAATINGATDAGVVWSVNEIAGGNSAVGTISTSGMYVAPASIPTPPQVIVRAASLINPTSFAASTITITGPPDPGPGLGTPNLSTGRFLEQAAFGPTPPELARVRQMGFEAWLDEQFRMPETLVIEPADNGLVRQQYLNRLSAAPDQLRQRVAYALGQIFVISMNKNVYPPEVVPYLRILSRNAFGNYRTLLGEISTSSQMGKYLDLANSNKPAAKSGANENYARELLQLFSVGLFRLNPDGSQELDAAGAPIPNYDQATIQQVALALTGWTYPGSGNNNWENFSAPLQPKDLNHDMRPKSFLGCNLPANQSAATDMESVLDCVFKHPSIGPFVATRLIRSLVTSNPSPAYVKRVSAVFANNGSGIRGDLQSVVRAILLDQEARNDKAAPNSGRLKEPIYQTVALVRSLNGRIEPTNTLSWSLSLQAQAPLVAPSVFGFYSPLFRIPNTTLFGPEFQIYSPSEAAQRGNFLWDLISHSSAETALTPFLSVAGNIAQLVDAIDQTLLYGRMPAPMRQSLANAIATQRDNTSRVQTALHLTILSGYYAVQH